MPVVITCRKYAVFRIADIPEKSDRSRSQRLLDAVKVRTERLEYSAAAAIVSVGVDCAVDLGENRIGRILLSELHVISHERNIE